MSFVIFVALSVAGVKNGFGMKVAVASSGLGHVVRGVETWARDTADALHERGLDVTLFSGAPVPRSGDAARCVAVPCIRRFSPLNRIIVRMLPRFTWRWGLKNGYGLEQLTFWMNLQRHLTQGRFDILHVQDPLVARWCRRAREFGRIVTKEILAHGTEEQAAFLAQFEFVQHLVPYHLETVLHDLEWDKAPCGWCVAPNFVDTSRFTPVESEDQKRGIRRRLGLPENAFVVGSAGAVKKTHKRMDYLVREFAVYAGEFEQRRPEANWLPEGKQRSGNETKEGKGANRSPTSALRLPVPHLVIAGARESETDELVKEARQVLGDNVTFLLDHPFEQMPDFYKALDVFVLPSLFEMMGIVYAEAMASGVPSLAHQHSVMEYVVGDGGRCIDMEKEGELAASLADFSKPQNVDWGRRARAHVERKFSKDVVIQKYVDYYKRLLAE